MVQALHGPSVTDWRPGTKTRNPTKPMTRVLLGLLTLGALIAAGVVLWLDRDAPATGATPAASVRPVPVETAETEARDLVRRLYVSGSLEASSRLEITPRVGGRIAEIAVDIGDAVEPGDLLLKLDAEEFQQELLQSQAELAVAQSSLAEARESLNAARRALARTRELRSQGIASAAELEAAESQAVLQQTRVDLAQSQLRQRTAALRSAEIRVSYARIEADWQGHGTRHVAERMADPGTVISVNTAVLALVALDPLRAVALVTEADYGRLRTGQTVRLRSAAWPEDFFHGTVARIAPEFREASRQARVEIEVPNADSRLRPGMFVEIAIDLERRDQMQSVPRDALLQRATGFVVFSIDTEVDPPIARRHRVTPGIRDGDWVEILEPELPRTVVTLGQHLLSDGNPVRLPASGAGRSSEAESQPDPAQPAR